MGGVRMMGEGWTMDRRCHASFAWKLPLLALALPDFVFYSSKQLHGYTIPYIIILPKYNDLLLNFPRSQISPLLKMH